jgi:hypothetical protein
MRHFLSHCRRVTCLECSKVKEIEVPADAPCTTIADLATHIPTASASLVKWSRNVAR